MKDGWFGTTLADRHFRVKEVELYNRKNYEVKRPRILTTSEQREKVNRKIKQQLKRTEVELTQIQKMNARKARLTMIET